MKWQLLRSRAFLAVDKLGSSLLPNYLFSSTYSQYLFSSLEKVPPAVGHAIIGLPA
ncbi:hypothetical protein EMIT0P176_20208 [Pseudomonas sp. IT-P176]